MNDITLKGDLRAGKTAYLGNDRPYKPTTNPRYAEHLAAQQAPPETRPRLTDEQAMEIPLIEFKAQILAILERHAPRDLGIPILCSLLGFECGDSARGGGPQKRLRNTLTELRREGRVDSNGKGRWRFVVKNEQEQQVKSIETKAAQPEPEAFAYPEPPLAANTKSQPGPETALETIKQTPEPESLAYPGPTMTKPDRLPQTVNELAGETMANFWGWMPEFWIAYQKCRDLQWTVQDFAAAFRLGTDALASARRSGACFPHDGPNDRDDTPQ